MSSNVLHVAYYGSGDHQTAEQGCIWLFGCSWKSVGLGRGLWTVCPLCLWHKSATAAAVCGLWRYISVIYICLWRCHCVSLSNVSISTNSLWHWIYGYHLNSRLALKWPWILEVLELFFENEKKTFVWNSAWATQTSNGSGLKVDGNHVWLLKCLLLQREPINCIVQYY